MSGKISRREFIKLSAFSLGATAASHLDASPVSSNFLEEGQIGRVAYESISVFDAPRLDARTVGFRFRDELINLFYPLTPLTGPAYNPHWYRINGGYIHSGLVQPVSVRYNTVLDSLPEDGRLSRLTLPYSRPYTYNRNDGWQAEELYLLYYGSNHWITDIVAGPDETPWYQITEAWEGVQYYVKAEHMQPYAAAELEPLSPDVPATEKRIEVSLQRQNLSAYEGDQIVLSSKISSGVNSQTGNGLPTMTPTGSFNISSKLSAKYMGANRLTDTLGDKFLPGVPWTAFFAEGGYAIHGAYWHNNFGAPMSRGCINLPPSEAQWLYRWITPAASADDWEARGFGTRVIVS
jgi:lipoprotein-anchoring transpeptidase ErfK/SrfK